MDEDGSTRLDRELDELLSELRVALPGVQVLFAFLLTVPFATGFSNITTLQRNAFFVAFVTTTLASAVLLAPTAYHRLRWRQFDKERLLEISTKLTVVGLALLTIAIASAAFVVTDVLYSTKAAVGVAAAVFVSLVGTWFALPLSRRRVRAPTGPVGDPSRPSN